MNCQLRIRGEASGGLYVVESSFNFCRSLDAMFRTFGCNSESDILFGSMVRYMQGKHLVDVTEIYRQLNPEKKKRFFKMAYLVILFIFSLFWYYDNKRSHSLREPFCWLF